MAAAACLSTNHLLWTYRSLFGKTPHQEVVEQRLQRAAELFRSAELSIRQVCYEVEFESPGSFSSLFKKHLGALPRAFRQSE
ncbi:TPA: hypothetical protein DCE37_13185 [Candidatus Latescibacteria bacterium]|nr:hypothetical protein [Candidatus Latescibacterota bacterium]